MRLWPDSLVGRTLAILLGITLLLIAGSAILLHQERSTRFDERNRFSLLNSISTLVRLVEDAGSPERQRIVERFSKENFRASIDLAPLVTGQPRHPMENFLSLKLRNRLNIAVGRIKVRIRMDLDDEDDDDDHRREHRQRSMMHEWGEIDFSIHLGDGSWLNIRVDHSDAPAPWANKTIGLLALLLSALIAGGMYLSQRMARPIAKLAKAADLLGLGQAITPQ